MKITFFVRASLLLLSLLSGQNVQAAAAAFTTAQQTEVQAIVREYLLKNPQVLIESIQTLQQQARGELQQVIQRVIVEQAAALFNAPHSPVRGNPRGELSVVEFFDYRCGYCKRMAATFDALTQLNPQIRLVYKQLPIFGADSTFAAQAALAAQLQGKFLALHTAMMTTTSPLTEENVLTLARATKLNIARLKTDMQSPSIAAELKNNVALAKQLQLEGTPALVLARVIIQDGHVGVPRGNIFLPGAISMTQLQQTIQQLAQA